MGSYTYGFGNAGHGPHAVTRAGSDTYTYDANGNLTGETLGDGSAGCSLVYTFNKVCRIEKGNHKVSFAYGPAPLQAHGHRRQRHND